jgi:prepilin-type N-terminal cleavage/methylation domain-containing protein
VRKAFTLLELLTVIIIISILAAWGLPNYTTSKEKASDKEAVSNLKIMQSAQMAYKLDAGTYYSNASAAYINQNLRVSVPTGTNRNWNYTAYSSGCVQAQRNGNDNRYWNLTINITNNDPSSAAVCP